MENVISNVAVNVVLYYLRKLIVNLGAYYIFGRVTNTNIFKIRNLKTVICIFLMTSLEMLFSERGGFASGAIVSILILWIILEKSGDVGEDYNISVVAIAI